MTTQRTMGQNQVILRHEKLTFPRANGRASGPVLTSLFLFVPDHSVAEEKSEEVSFDVTSVFDEIDDSKLYFSPDQGNVVFAR